jgi:hypothetical protein
MLGRTLGRKKANVPLDVDRPAIVGALRNLAAGFLLFPAGSAKGQCTTYLYFLSGRF